MEIRVVIALKLVRGTNQGYGKLLVDLIPQFHSAVINCPQGVPKPSVRAGLVVSVVRSSTEEFTTYERLYK